MKYEVTQEDRDTMTRDMTTDKTLKHLRDLSFYKFSIGDVLVRRDRHRKWDNGNDSYEWKTSIAQCGLPHKYVYVFENELGVGYIRRLSVNGRKFVDRPICVTEFDPDQVKFELDPEYADHMLLSHEDDDFDTKSRYDEVKRKREQINRKNKKLALVMPDEAAAIDWMSKLKVGDHFWYGYSVTNISKDPFYVHEISLVEPPGFKQQYSTAYYMPRFEPNIKVSTQAPNGSNTPQPAGYNNTLGVGQLMRYHIFTQRPFFVEEVIN
jgi:hypothetical protein